MEVVRTKGFRDRRRDAAAQSVAPKKEKVKPSKESNKQK